MQANEFERLRAAYDSRSFRVGHLSQTFYEVAEFANGRWVSSLDNPGYGLKVEKMAERYGEPKYRQALYSYSVTPYGIFPGVSRLI